MLFLVLVVLMLHGRNAAGLGGICLETDGRDSAGHVLIGRNVFLF